MFRGWKNRRGTQGWKVPGGKVLVTIYIYLHKYIYISTAYIYISTAVRSVFSLNLTEFVQKNEKNRLISLTGCRNPIWMWGKIDGKHVIPISYLYLVFFQGFENVIFYYYISREMGITYCIIQPLKTVFSIYWTINV